ncbi:MAG: hypothetical protein ACTSSJ_04880 [Candidatus Odinarchaeia archaeon]
MGKYPWCAAAARKINELNITLDNLVKKYPSVIECAYSRLNLVVTRPFKVYFEEKFDDLTKLLAFPTIRVILNLLGDSRLNHRWATFESKAAENMLLEETSRVITFIASDTFGWKLEHCPPSVTGIPRYSWRLYFLNYIETASSFHDINWKLANRFLKSGFVYLNNDDLVRLMAEAVKHRLLKHPSSPVKPTEIPKELRDVAEKIKVSWEKKKDELGVEEGVIGGPIDREAFPPCIQKLLSAALNGENIPHQGRFALTAFLLNIGMDVEQVITLFKAAPDFREDLTRYQVEHISGLRGTRVKYTPPSCDTLKTYDLCPQGHELCNKVKHPLTFYKRARRRKNK